MEPFYEGRTHNFYAISSQAETALATLSDREWTFFLVAADVFESSRASGRPHERVVVGADSEFFVLDTTAFGGRSRLVCARRGRRVLVAQVVGRRRAVGQRELEAARDAVRDWRRANRGRRPDARDA